MLKQKEAVMEKKYEQMLQTNIKEHDQKITANLTKLMDQKLAQELSKKDQENEATVKQA